jgi:hypothetical protein
MSDYKKPIVFFLPETGVQSFIRAIGILTTAVLNQRGRALVTKCTGQFISRCMMQCASFISHDASYIEKNELCKKCSIIFDQAKNYHGFETINLADLINSKIEKEIEEIFTNTLIAPEDIVYKGFHIGIIAQNDYALERKSPYDINLNEKEKNLYFAYVKSTAIAVALSDEIYKIFKPQTFVTLSEYSQCQGVHYIAQKYNVNWLWTSYPAIFNADGSRLTITKKSYTEWYYGHCQRWHQYNFYPISENTISISWQDIIFRWYSSGSHIYSNSKHDDLELLFNKLGLDKNKKLLVAYTSSSDERYGVDLCSNIWKYNIPKRKFVFEDQIEWLKFLQEYVSKRNDIQIVVRIHPREGINKNYSFRSSYVEKLQKIFSVNLNNFIIIWPEDPISSYDLAEISHASLIAWSSLGPEFARVGIPALSYCIGTHIQDDDFIQTVGTIEEYKQRLDSIITEDSTWLMLVKAVRFFSWQKIINAFDLSETVPVNIHDGLWHKPPINIEKPIMAVLTGSKELEEYTITDWLKNINLNALENENEANRLGIRILLDKIFYHSIPKSDKKTFVNKINKGFIKKIYNRINKLRNSQKGVYTDYNLEFYTDESKIKYYKIKTKKNKNLRILVGCNWYASMIKNGKLVKRMSPMLVRLARIYSESFK